MGSQGSDHCCLLGQKGRIPENRNDGLHSIISVREEAASRVLNGSGDPGRFTCLGANSQQNLLTRCCTSCHGPIEKRKVVSSLSWFQSTPVLSQTDPVHAGIGQDLVRRLDAAVCERKDPSSYPSWRSWRWNRRRGWSWRRCRRWCRRCCCSCGWSRT